MRVLFQLTAAPGSGGSDESPAETSATSPGGTPREEPVGANKVSFSVDGRAVSVEDDGATLLEVLRDRLGLRSAKDGCSPQGQCGCCTVWVDGAARVSCVTPVRRVDGRSVTTLEGLDPALLSVWTDAFTRAGASQCGFCTPGIIMRLAALARKKPRFTSEDVATGLAAHLCRCTGWRTIFEAAENARVDLSSDLGGGAGSCGPPDDRGAGGRDIAAASLRAEIEGRCTQKVGPLVAAGLGGFADDSAPPGALVAVPDSGGGWSVGGTLTEARRLSNKIQGRNSGARVGWPLEVPVGDWALALQTTFVEPAYLEPDASWCAPGGGPASPVANGGAFGGKENPVVTGAASMLATRHGRAVRVLLSREDVVRLGPKRPPIAAGMRSDGSGEVRVGLTPGSGDISGWIDSFVSFAPRCNVEVVEIPGPPVASEVRGAGWVEAGILSEAVRASTHADGIGSVWTAEMTSPDGGRASVTVGNGAVRVSVDAGEVLDWVVLRSYCVGAVHQALGWVRSEAVAVDATGQVLDLTIRSFGIMSAREMPPVEVELKGSDGPSVNVSDAVFGATAASAWIGAGLAPRWPLSQMTAIGDSR